MVIQRRIGDIIHSAAMMVDDGDPPCGTEQVGTGHLIGTVGIYHDHQGAGIQFRFRFRLAQKDSGIFRQGSQTFDHDGAGNRGVLSDNIGGNVSGAGDGTDACGSTYRVQIGEFMSHDNDLGGGGNELVQCAGHDAAFDLSAPLRLFGAAAVKFECLRIFDHNLVAASAECHLQRQGGELEHFLKSASHADADGQSGSEAIGAGDFLHRLQQGEFALTIGGEMLFLKDEQVAVSVIPADQAVGGSDPLGDLPFNAGAHLSAAAVSGVADEFLIVVNGDDGNHRTGGVVAVAEVAQVGHIQPVGGGHIAGMIFAAHADQLAKDLVAASLNNVFIWALCLSIKEPLGGELGDRRGNVGVEDVRSKNRSLLQMTSPFSGRKMTMGKGELVMVSLPAWVMFRLRVSMKPVTFCSLERRVSRW